MRIHPEGVEFLKAMGVAALILGILALRFAAWPAQVMEAIFARVSRNFPPPELEPLTTKRKGTRRLRPTKAQRRSANHIFEKNKIVFDWFAGILTAYGLADWLLLPESYKLPEQQRWPVLLSLAICGTILIFVGFRVWDDRIGWKKWTFWVSIFGTLLVILALTQWMTPMRPRSIWTVLLAAGLTFVWLFGTLRRIDRSNLERNRLQDMQLQDTSIRDSSRNL